MSTPIIAPALLGNVIGSFGDSFVIAEWTEEGGRPGPPRYVAPLHLHHNDDEAWYVLEGKLCVQVGQDIVEAGAGSCVFVPRGTAHSYWNPDPISCRYLLIMTANIHRLIQAIHAAADRSPAAMRALFHNHGSELLSTP